MTSYDVLTEVTDGVTDGVTDEVTDGVADEVGAEVYAVYDVVFGDQPDQQTWRDTVWDRHASRSGFRLARAYDDGRLVGIGYGYTGERGQWWTDQAARVLEPEVSGEWLGGHFELVSIGVVPGARGSGVGAGLLAALVDGLPHERWLLMTTADAEDPARRLYAAQGWEVVGPGLHDGQVIMGRRRA